MAFDISAAGFNVDQRKLNEILAEVDSQMGEETDPTLEKLYQEIRPLGLSFIALKHKLQAMFMALQETNLPMAVGQQLNELQSIADQYQRLVQKIEAKWSAYTEGTRTEGVALVEKFRKATSGAIAAPPEEPEAPVLEDVGGTNSAADRAEQARATLDKVRRLALAATESTPIPE